MLKKRTLIYPKTFILEEKKSILKTIISFIPVLGKPAANVDDNAATGDYYSDDYEDEYDDKDNEVNQNNETDVGALQSEPAFFLKNEFTIHANEGSTAILECDAEKLKGKLVSL